MTLSSHMLTVLGTLLAVAAASDAAARRIPNGIVGAIAVTGLAHQALAGRGAAGLADGSLALLAAGLLLLPAWARGWLGGGDVKLGAASAAWVGLESLATYALASAIAVGVVALWSYVACAHSARAAVRRNLLQVAHGVPVSVSRGGDGGRASVPAGIGFAVGALVALALSGRS